MGVPKNKNNLQHVINTTHHPKTKTERYLLQKRQHLQALNQSLKYLTIIVIITMLVDTLFFEHYTLTRSLALGAGLNWLSHVIFSRFVFRYTGAQQHRQIVHQMYTGQMIKWSLTLVGFALIFNYVRPINTFAVFLGYISMVLVQSIALFRME